MNKTLLMGRLTADPEIKKANDLTIARYTLAVDRRRKDQEQTADFIRCVVFGKGAEFAEKYLQKGMRILLEGHIQTGSYKDKDGKTVYTTDVVVEAQEFCERKQQDQQPVPGFMQIPDSIDEELPFH